MQRLDAPISSMMDGEVILFVGADRAQEALTTALLGAGGPGPQVISASDATDALTLVAGEAPYCMIVDLATREAAEDETLVALHQQAPDVAIVALGADDDESALVALRRGANEYLVKGHIDADTMARAVRRAVERKRLEVELVFSAMHDSMTGLPNRAMFLERLRSALPRCARHGTKVAVMFLDLDGFKGVNDSLGHAAGDAVLVEVAQRLAASVRPSDVIARFGGDEFTLMCEDITSERDAFAIVRRIERAMKDPIRIPEDEVALSASVGTSLADGTANLEDVLADADHALYEAKRRGRGSHVVYDAGLRSKVDERRALEKELRKALDAGELLLHYQDQIDVGTGRVTGVEALIRWEHPERGLLTPEEFIPAAEASGLMERMGRFVLAAACGQVSTWRGDGQHAADLGLSVNVSFGQLLDPELAAAVESALDASGTDPGLLCLEIKESDVMHDAERATAAMRRVRDLGIRLSIDDYGTGNSSLSHLARFPIDDLKVDRSFVGHLEDDDEASTLSATIIRLAHNMGLTATAEGIESEAQLRALAALGCDYAQGYYLGRPYPATVSI